MLVLYDNGIAGLASTCMYEGAVATARKEQDDEQTHAFVSCGAGNGLT
jgi:hypothetical protein